MSITPEPNAAIANPSTALARVVVDELARGGIVHAVVSPGSRNTALAVAFVAHPTIRVHVHPDERSAAFVALGIGRATGQPAVVVTTSGSATANLYPAVVEADTGDVPLLLLTADRPAELRHTGANQTVIQPGMFGAAVRWAVEVPAPSVVAGELAFWRSTVCRAIDEASGAVGPAGPVHVDIAFREPTVPVSDDGRTSAQPYPFATDGRPSNARWTSTHTRKGSEPGAASSVLRTLIRDARRPLLLAGGGAGPEARKLSDALDWPLIAEAHTAAHGGTNAIHHADLILASSEAREHLRPDLVLQVGRPGLSRGVERWLDGSITQILVDRHGRRHDPGRTLQHLIVGDPETLLMAAAALPHKAEPGWAGTWRDADALAAEAVERVLGDGCSEPVVAITVTNAIPDGGTLVVGSSRPIRDVNAVAHLRAGTRVIANRGASGIDGVVSTALGAALAGARPTVALLGDLTLLHDSNGFLLSPDQPIDLVVVVVDNDGGGLFHLLPQADHLEPDVFERVIAAPHGRDLAHLADLHALRYTRLEEPDALREAIDAAVVAGGLHLLHVRSDRHATREVDARLRLEVSASLHRAFS